MTSTLSYNIIVFNMVIEAIRSSGAIYQEEYEDVVKRLTTGQYHRYQEGPKLKLREVSEEEDLLVLISKIKVKTDQIQTAFTELAAPAESLEDTYRRVAGDLDKKYDHPVLAMYFHAVGSAGADFIDNAVALCKTEEDHSKYLAEAFDKEHNGTYNPYRAVNEMFEEGVWPKGFRSIEGHEVFVADVPLIMRTSSNRALLVMGCLSQGEERIKFVHSLNNDCRYNLDLSFPSGQGQPRKVEPSQITWFMSEPPVLGV